LRDFGRFIFIYKPKICLAFEKKTI
jgi:hypothetical protein